MSILKQRHHCVYALNYHLVLVTKYRRKILTDVMLKVIETSLWEAVILHLPARLDAAPSASWVGSVIGERERGPDGNIRIQGDILKVMTSSAISDWKQKSYFSAIQ